MAAKQKRAPAARCSFGSKDTLVNQKIKLNFVDAQCEISHSHAVGHFTNPAGIYFVEKLSEPETKPNAVGLIRKRRSE